MNLEIDAQSLLDDAQELWCRARTTDELSGVEEMIRRALQRLEICSARRTGCDTVKVAFLDSEQHIHLHAAVQRLGVLLLQRDAVG